MALSLPLLHVWVACKVLRKRAKKKTYIPALEQLPRLMHVNPAWYLLPLSPWINGFLHICVTMWHVFKWLLRPCWACCLSAYTFKVHMRSARNFYGWPKQFTRYGICENAEFLQSLDTQPRIQSCIRLGKQCAWHIQNIGALNLHVKTINKRIRIAQQLCNDYCNKYLV